VIGSQPSPLDAAAPQQSYPRTSHAQCCLSYFSLTILDVTGCSCRSPIYRLNDLLWLDALLRVQHSHRGTGAGLEVLRYLLRCSAEVLSRSTCTRSSASVCRDGGTRLYYWNIPVLPESHHHRPSGWAGQCNCMIRSWGRPSREHIGVLCDFLYRLLR